jgi:hypothetical protein
MYERVYDVGLLDDLHNYFPAVLYEPQQFRNIQDLLLYIRDNATRRFNLYEHGRQSYTRQVPQNTIHTPPIQSQRPPPRTVPVVRTWTDPLFTDDFSFLVPLLRTLDRFTPQQPPLQDVIVHASQELINTASTTTCLVADMENNCSICQDRMRQGETIRKLNACHHEFHSECVDSWFLRRSVLCPVCRHDIRNPEIRRSPLITANTNPPDLPDILTGRFY